jgi:transcriptional regulator with XRE-family HTH domain
MQHIILDRPSIAVFSLLLRAVGREPRRCVMKVSQMGTTEFSLTGALAGNLNPSKPLQRIKAVRKQQGINLRRIARQTGVRIRDLEYEELETTDLPLSRLYWWQQLLDVPVCDLLVESNAPLSTHVMERARLVRVMKTVAAIKEQADSLPIQRLTETLVNQLIEIMPELRDVSPWHSVGQRRSLEEFGRIAERTISISDLLEH